MRVKFIISSFVILSLIGVVGVRADDRGEGVGALLSKSVGSTTVNIINGHTAPRAEVIVENNNGQIQAVALLDDRGIFNFVFDTDAFGSLQIYAIDQLDIANRVPIVGSVFVNEILPPSIASDGASLADKAVDIFGFTYPGASVAVHVKSDVDYDRNFSSTAGSDGKWTVTANQLTPGRYIANVTASFGGKTSGVSYDVEWEIPGLALVIEKLPEEVKKVADVTSKLLVPVAIVVTAVPAIATGLGSLWYYLLRLLVALRGLFYFGRKKRKWGVVYDAVTKAPVTGAVVRLYTEAGMLVETEVTGKEGIFSFLPEPGRYKIAVLHPGYLYPSKLVVGRTDGEYEGVYHGEVVEVRSKTAVLNLSIPIDLRDYGQLGWKVKFKLWLRRNGFKLEMAIMLAGLVFSVIAYLTTPSTLNMVILIFYGVMISFGLVRAVVSARAWGVVVDERGRPVTGVSLSLLETTFGRQVARRVTDALGRFQFVAPAGGYSMLVTSPEYKLVTRRGVYGGEEIKIKRGKDVIRPRVQVRRN